MITIETITKAPSETVWELWNNPEHIKNWCFATDDWYVPGAENDLKVGGKFRTAMAARDGSSGFDFEGIYTNVRKNEKIEYLLGDGRKVEISFTPVKEGVKIVESFDPEQENSEELQRGGWQSILDNFKKYADKHK